MGHHAEHVAALVDDARDVVEGAIGVGLGRGHAVRIGVAEDHLAVQFQVDEFLGVGEIAALAVGDGHAEGVASLASSGEGRVGVLHAQVRPLAPELEVVVAEQGAGEQTGLAQDLEAVAAPEDKSAALGVGHHGLHDGRKAGDGAGAEVVAVGKAAGSTTQSTPLRSRSLCHT